MPVTLTILRYPKKYIPFEVMAMAIHYLPLWINKKFHFINYWPVAKTAHSIKIPIGSKGDFFAGETGEINVARFNEFIHSDMIYGFLSRGWCAPHQLMLRQFEMRSAAFIGLNELTSLYIFLIELR